MQAHRFLETIKETLTVQAMREKLRSTGAIAVLSPSPLIIPLLPPRFSVERKRHSSSSFFFLIN
jgi:hypothetical protein